MSDNATGTFRGMSVNAQRALIALDYHIRNNFWRVQLASDLGKWRCAAAPCLASEATFDVSGHTLDSCLKIAWDAMSDDFKEEARTAMETKGG